MNNTKFSAGFGISLLVIIAITVVVFVWIYEKDQRYIQQSQNVPAEIKPIQSATTDQQNQDTQMISITEEVSFCGKVYKTDRVVIDDEDISKVIAKIAEKETWLCKNMELGKFQESGISIAQKKDVSNNSYLVVFFNRGDLAKEYDPFNQSPNIFKFDFDNNIVSYQNQFDGVFKLLGVIK